MIEQPKLRDFFAGGSERQRNPGAEQYFQRIFLDHRSRWGDGEVNPVQHEVASESIMAEEVKKKTLSLGASLVGITTATQDHVYEGRQVPEKYLISLAMDMDFDQIDTAPSAAAETEVARVYYELGEVTLQVAEYIRSLGYPAYAHHPLGAGRLVQVPYAVAAGLGEQGRNGILVTPQFGCRVRLGAVTTDLPLTTDEPREWGIGTFCERCQLCSQACPAGAIPEQRSSDRGIKHFVIDWEKCRPYFNTHYGCAICIKVCIFSRRPDSRFLNRLSVLKGRSND